MVATWFVAGVGVAIFVGVLIGKRISRMGATAHSEIAITPIPTSEAVDQLLLNAFDLLPIGVVISRDLNSNLLRNRIAAEMTGIRHVDILVDEAVVALVKETVVLGEQEKSLKVAGPPDRFFSLRSQTTDNVCVVVTVEDITDRVRIDTVRTDFVANLSHELKTPIGGIAALGDTMIDETDPAKIRQLADRIVRESFRMAHIVDDLLDLSRIEFGRTTEWDNVAMSSVVGEVSALLSDQAREHSVELSTKGNFDAEVLGDRNQLVSAFSNLIENAIKYSEPHRSVRITGELSPEFISVSVADQGIGIAPKDHERIFERFYRVDRARSRSTGGTGLGLSIVRHVIDNHGGKISVQSNEGEGATFTVVLPRLKEVRREPAN
ncbi:MAG: GHKL domain-containing protein [Actinobacteria bacterium]|nr:MAG: GHKL domain-containing protein [Actinomycetota bacterium]